MSDDTDDTELGPPRCDVYGCESYAPVEYTDGSGKRCLDCFDADRDMGVVPTPDRSIDTNTDRSGTNSETGP